MGKIPETKTMYGRVFIYEYIRGSRCHGLDTELSDTDYGGIYVEPNDKLLGLRVGYVKDIDLDNHNKTYWELNRFMELLAESNPTILEALFVDDRFVLVEHPAITELKRNRDKFLTKRCFNSFGSYAIKQIKKARGLNKKIVNPVTERKDPLDFCYTFYRQGSSAIKRWLEYRGLKQNYCGLVNIPNMHNCYGMYYDWGNHIVNDGIEWEDFYRALQDENDSLHKFAVFFSDSLCGDDSESGRMACLKYAFDMAKPIGYKGIIGEDGKSTSVRLSSVEKGVLPVCYVNYNEDGYISHCKKYKEYKEWEEKRNKVRYESNLHKNYDCYLDSETEFLTLDGWKKYDDVLENDLIATFDESHSIKFEPYISRYDSIYSGVMWTLETSYTRCTVTPNHKLYMSHSFINKKTGNKYRYLPGENVWEHITVDDFIKNRKGRYFILNNLKNDKRDDLYDDELLVIIGLFLSEGTVVYKKDGSIKYIRISQLSDGKAYEVLHGLSDTYKCGEYHYNKRKNRDEVSFDFKNELLFSLVEQCIVDGKYSYQKNMPAFAYKLSKRQFDILFQGMMLGDGHFHKNGNLIYYTSSKNMAVGLHTLLSINGYNAQLYGKNGKSYDRAYKSSFAKNGHVSLIYQVFVSKNDVQYKLICKTEVGKNGRKNCGLSKKNVFNEKIVCFEMKNGTLVTRNDNKMAYHCNSKNMCECVRLVKLCTEIAKDGCVRLDRNGIDRDFLLGIKNHAYEYDELMEMVVGLENEMNDAVAKSSLPDDISKEYVDELTREIRRKYIFQAKKIIHS